MPERPGPGAASGGPAPPAGIEGVDLPGPFPVGEYARALRDRLRGFRRVQLFGEVSNLGTSKVQAYFELRDAGGAVPVSVWRSDLDRLGLPEGALADGAQVVVAGGCDYYGGSATASPSFSFRATALRPAGEGDLLAQIARLRAQLAAEGLTEPQKRLPRPALPRTIGVVTGEQGKARGDVLAALQRRGWAGRLVWAFAPVQGGQAAPRIGQALQDLAAAGAEVAIVARGGGSVADLLAFSDETLCRTVALLPIPVIASLGHHADRTVLDDVAAASCSTPTHAAETAVPIAIGDARASARDAARQLQAHGRRATAARARTLRQLARVPAERVERQRARLHQQLREIRAAARRGRHDARRHQHTVAVVLGRKAAAAALEPRRATLRARAAALAAHDPDRTLARGYVLARGPAGEVVTTTAGARAAGTLDLAFQDGSVRAAVEDPAP
ncbi:MAG: exodeoxyribonuclease VII large subunit [Solirubrobacteraceae bacterium]